MSWKCCEVLRSIWIGIYRLLVQFLMFLYGIPLAFAVTSNVFGVSESFYSGESENIGGQFF